MDKEYLKLAADEISATFPDNHGFVLLVTPFNVADARAHYISNITREDAIVMLKEFLFRVGSAEDWMKHIQ